MGWGKVEEGLEDTEGWVDDKALEDDIEAGIAGGILLTTADGAAEAEGSITGAVLAL